MNWALMGAAALVGYLCGSISFARIIVKAHGHDAVEVGDSDLTGRRCADDLGRRERYRGSADAGREVGAAVRGGRHPQGDDPHARIPVRVSRASRTSTRRG